MALQIDRVLLFSVLLLIAFGIVMVTSASMIAMDGDSFTHMKFFFKQSVAACIGLGLMSYLLFVPTSTWQRWHFEWMGLSILLLIIVLIPGIGHAVNGSRRWLKFGPISIQASEFVKLFCILFLAGYIQRHSAAIQESIKALFLPLALFGLIGVLLLVEPDLGATLVIFSTMLGLLFMAGVKLRWFGLLLGLAGAALVVLILFSPYRLARLTGFLNPWENQYGSGYQLTQSLIAFGRGGWFGVGLGDSIQKLYYLPEAHTDFILAIIAEELGLFGIVMLLCVISVLVWRGLSIARISLLRNAVFESMTAFGITFWLALQDIINVGVNIGLLPTKGLTLPFVSYSGSGLVVDCIIIGILLRIDLENKAYDSSKT